MEKYSSFSAIFLILSLPCLMGSPTAYSSIALSKSFSEFSRRQLEQPSYLNSVYDSSIPPSQLKAFDFESDDKVPSSYQLDYQNKPKEQQQQLLSSRPMQEELPYPPPHSPKSGFSLQEEIIPNLPPPFSPELEDRRMKEPTGPQSLLDQLAPVLW